MKTSLLALALLLCLFFGVDARRQEHHGGKKGVKPGPKDIQQPPPPPMDSPMRTPSTRVTSTSSSVAASSTQATTTATRVQYVGSCAPSTQQPRPTSIQDAVDNAYPGQTIALCPQTFNEAVTISSVPVRLVGTRAGDLATEITQPLVVDAAAVGTSIIDITFSGTTGPNLSVQASDVEVRGNTFIVGADETGVEVYNTVYSFLFHNNSMSPAANSDYTGLLFTEGDGSVPRGQLLTVEYNNFSGPYNAFYVQASLNGLVINRNNVTGADNADFVHITNGPVEFLTITSNTFRPAVEADTDLTFFDQGSSFVSNSTISNNIVTLTTGSYFLLFGSNGDNGNYNINITSNTVTSPSIALLTDLSRVRFTLNAFTITEDSYVFDTYNGDGYELNNLQFVVNEVTFYRSEEITNLDDTSVLSSSSVEATGRDFRLSPNLYHLVRNPNTN